MTETRHMSRTDKVRFKYEWEDIRYKLKESGFDLSKIEIKQSVEEPKGE